MNQPKSIRFALPSRKGLRRVVFSYFAESKIRIGDAKSSDPR
jgi:hypothetical protein